MWLSQRFQGLTSALFPVFSLTSLISASTVTSTSVYYIEASSVPRFSSTSLFGLRAVASQYASLLGVG